MKSSLKKKIALMLLEALKRKGLPSVIPPDFQEAQDLLGRLGYALIIKTLLYDTVTGRRLQTVPKDTSKEIYLKAFDLPAWNRQEAIDAGWTRRRDEVIWVRMDMDTAMKSLTLGFLP